ncbi:unnamed protein product [Cuscuta epithymum]|nr:unnamed protein product [Cuscuta epithymum]
MGVMEGLKHHGNMRRKYRISGLTSQDTRELTFPVDELGTTKSVIQYFREKYGVDIGLTHWPCLQVGNQQRANYLPMEVCQIVEGQRYSKQLNERQITALLKTTHKQPKDREQEILQVVASQDWPEISKYVASVSAQAHRQEPIQNLHLTRPHPHTGKIQCAGMIRTLIKSFCEASRTQKMPERIIFYRDGVSEGQIYQVLHAELDAIRKDPYWNKLLWYCVENGSYNGCFLPVRQESVTHESAGWRNEERNQPKNVEPIKQESESGHNWDGITPPASGNNLEDIPSPASGNNWEDIPVPASGNNWNDIPPTESGNNWEDLPPPVTDENEWSHHGWNNWDVIPPPESGYYNWEDIPAPASGNNWNDIPAPASGNNWNDIPSPAFGNWEDILASGNWEDIPAPASGNNWNDIPPTESGNNWEDLPPPVTDENEWSHHGGNNCDVIPQPEYDYGDWEDIPWLVAQDG